MTEYRKKFLNRIFKFAMLNLIEDTMKSKAVAFVHTDEGYDKESDMIHFSSDGHNCILLGVGCPNHDNAIIPLKVRTEWEGKPNVSVDVNLELEFIHINTIEKIACEVYSLLWNPEEDEEWEVIRQWYFESYMQEFDR